MLLRAATLAILIGLPLEALADNHVTVSIEEGDRTRAGFDDGRSELLSIGGAIYGPRSGWLRHVGLVAEVTATLASEDMQDIIFADGGRLLGTPSWTGGAAALRGRLLGEAGEAGLSLGVGSMEFTYAERDLLDAVIAPPVDTYRYTRLAIDGRLQAGRFAAIGSFGGRYVFDGTSDVDVGFDASVGVGARLAGPLELQLSGLYEEFRATSGGFRDETWRARLGLSARW